MSVNTQHPDYDKYAKKWKRARDVVAGQDAVRLAGIAYLPKLKDESDEDYRARLSRSDFFNGTWRTINGLRGMAFRKDPTVDVPPAIEPYLEDVNMAGVEMDDLASEALEEVLSVGRIGILVDHPPKPDNVAPITVDAAQKMGLRPTLQVYMAESIINWKFARVNNSWALTMVVLKEVEMIPEDEFKDKPEDRYRVLDLDPAGYYRQRLFKLDDKGKDEQIGGDLYPLMANKPLTYVPFALVGAGGRGDCIDEPPLIDLIDANLALYQINADYRHGLHFTGLPTMMLTGMESDGKPFYIGSQSAIVATQPEAKGFYIEFNGQGLTELREAIKEKRQEMALAGARMIADETKQVETLGATQIKRTGENSVLAQVVQSLSKSLEWALGIFAEWAGHATEEIVYQINRDFNPMMLDAQQLTALVGAVQAGKMSNEEFFDIIQRGDLVKADVTFEEHQEQIDAGGPPRPAAAAPVDQGAEAA